VLAAAGATGTVADAEPLEDVREAVRLLPPAQRDAVLLHHVDGLSCDEIAAALDSTPGAVRVRLHRAREELRRRLAPHATVLPPRKEIPMIEVAIEDAIVRVDADDPSKLVLEQRIVVLRREERGACPANLDRCGRGQRPCRPASRSCDAASTHRRPDDRAHARARRPRRSRSDYAARRQHLVRIRHGRSAGARRAAERCDQSRRPHGAPILVTPDVLDEAGLVGDALLAAKLESSAEHIELPPGEWRSLSSELLEAMYR